MGLLPLQRGVEVELVVAHFEQRRSCLGVQAHASTFGLVEVAPWAIENRHDACHRGVRGWKPGSAGLSGLERQKSSD